MGLAAKYLGEARRAEIARTLFTVTSVDEAKGELHGLCPLHGEKNPSFSYNFKKDVYKCLSCNADGDLIRLWFEVKGYGRKEGFRAFCEAYDIPIDLSGRAKNTTRDRSEKETPPLDPAVVNEQMERALELFTALPDNLLARMEKERGWSRKWMEILDLRLQTHYLSKKGALVAIKVPDRLAVLVRDTDGNLVNIRLYRPGAKRY